MTSAAQSANSNAKQAARSRPVKIAARVGILAYGITHLLIGGLALQVAFGQGGEQADQTGAFQALAQQPYGPPLLWVLAIGFVAAAVWRAELAIWGYGYVSVRSKYLRKKIVSGVKAVIFVALAILAGTTAAGGSGGGGGQQEATAGVFGLPGGQFIVGLIGLVVLAVGVVKVVEGYQKKFLEEMDAPSDARARTVLERVGQIGNVAKGVSIGLIGVLLVVAAIRFRPEEATGLDAALKGLAAQPYGPYLLIAVALGLVSYGVFCFFDARYHRV
ncbi:DUF1206 domain-containing protein [Pseudonocardia abyssalis]|uniref:DUF1206 domain-containing protein n=1 Tax=Pseudonocardia abyssalis TaxID=2792008 RepID=A0ABS6UUD5_9PSEU|nr:DUF1206 domain-containing protein [Pseudonocardia abyssalis]MBW0114391.1 DUF1206 domain-containing protein [Pseudonocardia abyssalis]MBW0135862.1 DUF1206 domain-containing protein [Pseudonocardia abyssalis]